MKKTHKISLRIMSFLLCTVLVMSLFPVFTFADENAADPFFNRVADVNTMDNWKHYFDLEKLDTSNAGGVWTDKSVFTDASAFPGVTMLDDQRNFLTALSAIAANKEIVGYSTVPTDTVFVLDVSGSMSNSSVTNLVKATNDAITKLYDINKNNRVGVVLYSSGLTNNGWNVNYRYESAITTLLPLNRYTPNRNDVFLTYNNDTVSVASGVENAAGDPVSASRTAEGGTFIQAGLWEAWEIFSQASTKIEGDNWQKDETRMPILVLMSDGAPTVNTSNYDNVDGANANLGNGSDEDLNAGDAFLTQLTASYVINQIQNHYQTTDPDVRALFYTLGFNIQGNSVEQIVAQSVMNPDNSTLTDNLWASYQNLTNNRNLSVTVKGTNGQNTNVAIRKNSYVTDKSYVDEYFSASGTGLTDAFDDIVNEIILQSRYYPTHLEGGSPDFSGYVTFEDTIGDYMEVKDIKGILLGDKLFDGHMMASKINNTSEGGLGTKENPTDLGDEFVRAIRTRLNINAETARQLLAAAYSSGQLSYTNDTTYSNYIGWYADASGSYLKPWDENSTEAAPQNAVYKVKSYIFLGETSGSIKNSDMMHLSVRVLTDIATGNQKVLLSIPASLIPMITYKVSLTGTSVDKAENVTLTVEDKNVSPIRFIFESGLRSDLNELNITRITNENNVADDGVTRQFWTNWFDISGTDHDLHKVSLAEFTPNKENERFYYTFDSAVYKKVETAGTVKYELVENSAPQNSGKLDSSYEYYHRRYVFKNEATATAGEDHTKPIFFYEKMSASSIESAVWTNNFTTLDNKTVGAWYVPMGTPARELQMYDEQKSTTDGIDTKSAHMVFHPYLTEENNLFYVDMNLGNNGLLEVTPAQGLKISKTVDIFETGTSGDFAFLITVHNADGTPYTGTAETWTTDLDVVPLGDGTEITFSNNGTYLLPLSKDQTFWMTNLPTGATYTVEEVSDNDDYKIKSVHVNGTSMGTMALGTIAANFIDDVDFVNTAIGEGDLVITKKVIDQNGNPVDVNDGIEFTVNLELTNSNGAVSGTFDSSKGQISVQNGRYDGIKLKEGESFVIRGIRGETQYTVTEVNNPDGFTLNAQESVLTGVIDTEANDEAIVVNTYAPKQTNGGNITVDVIKQITGNRTDWLVGESYTFEIRRSTAARVAGELVTQLVIDANTTNKTVSYTLTNEVYPTAGTYYYTITEIVGTQGGITYDTATRSFVVVVEDSDMDGDLEITDVRNDQNTVVTKDENGYTVTANVNNVYAPTGSATATIEIQKAFTTQNHALNGYQFALYDANPLTNPDAKEILRSPLTDALGKTAIELTYAANLATVEGKVYTYYLAEINADQQIGNVKYTDKVYEVKITVKDNKDGTISTNTVIVDEQNNPINNPTFTNEYVPSQSAFVTLSGKKTITGHDRAVNAGEFKFKIERITNNAPLPSVTEVVNDTNGYFAFHAIEFNDELFANTSEKTLQYQYVIFEDDTNIINGFDYSSVRYIVTVSVERSDDYTKLTTTVTISDGTNNVSDIEFVNHYDPTDAKVSLSGTKILTGKTLENEEFSFVITPVTTGAPMGANIVKNNVSGVITFFDELIFDKAGTYLYTISEEAKTSANGTYDCDDAVYTVTVKVTDNSQGKLSADVTLQKNGVDSSEIVFRNAYTPNSITYDIAAKFGGNKELTGRTMKAGEFEFALINARNGQQIGNTVKNDAQGAFSFPAVSLPEAGVYHFKITEIMGGLPGVSYDTSSFHVRLNVVQDTDGSLRIDSEKLYKGVVSKEEVGGVLTEITNYTDITTDGINGIKFNNTYKADPAYVTLEATKTLTGRDLVDGEFKFDLHKTDSTYTYGNATLEQHDVVLALNPDGTGAVVFMPLMFTAEGTYHYVIVEDEVDEKGVTADKTAYKIEITVTDNHKGNLIATVKVNGNDIADSTADDIVFKNTYKAAATEIVIQGKKTLTGRTLKDKEFSFELYDKDGAKLQTVSNDADGKILFDEISVDKAGEYRYTVKEIVGNAAGVSYDKATYTVIATVTDNLDGTFKVVYAYQKDGVAKDTLSFANTYKALPTTIVIEAVKTLDGRTLTADEFAFELYDAAGTKLQTAKNAADGKIKFNEIAITDAGTYAYTVKEVVGNAKDIGYDTSVYTVTATVTDNLDGTFKVEYQLTKGGDAVQSITFANVYNPKTGDNTNLWLYLALLTVSGGLMGISFCKKKKEA